MCSILGVFHSAESSSVTLTITTSKDLATSNRDDMVEWCAAFTLFARLFAYIGILALMMLVIFLIMKYITDINEEGNLDREIRHDETNPLRPAKAMDYSYGTCNADLECGHYSACSSDSSHTNHSAEELYDGKLCVICFDEERNCFFVPCGHCATCYICAQRIFHGENKVCPVCRRFIGKVRKLFAS